MDIHLWLDVKPDNRFHRALSRRLFYHSASVGATKKRLTNTEPEASAATFFGRQVTEPEVSAATFGRQVMVK